MTQPSAFHYNPVPTRIAELGSGAICAEYAIGCARGWFSDGEEQSSCMFRLGRESLLLSRPDSFRRDVGEKS